MTFIIFIAVLLVTVLVHEWGHFFSAKKFGMLVEEFGFGIPPRIWSWKKGETSYSINALPFGGFVKIAGENGEESGKDISRQFESKPWYAKSIVLVAGVLANIILAIILFTAAYSIGVPSISEDGTPTVLSVEKNAPAEKAGIRTGDIVKAVVKNGNHVKPLTTISIKETIANETTPITFVIQPVQGGEERTISITPEEKGGVVRIGLGVEPTTVERLPFFKSLSHAVDRTWFITKAIFQTVGQLIGSLFGGEKVGGLVGPVGLAREVGNASTIGFAYLLAFTALISINLAVLNILPFPALDGGRLLIVVLEAISRKKFSKRTVGFIHTAGFLILITLMLVLTVKDVSALL